jgi:hypothetical protein
MHSFVPVLAIAAVLAPAASPAPAPLLGPGGVIEMHRQLFAALDRGDSEAVKSFVDDENRDADRQGSVFLPDVAGAPAEAWGSAGMRDLLGRFVAEQTKLGGEWKTTITRVSADCPSSAVSYALLEIARSHNADGKTDVEKYQGTGLVHFNDGHWKLFHLHLSPANAASTSLAKK